jgi:hypothetical protein
MIASRCSWPPTAASRTVSRSRRSERRLGSAVRESMSASTRLAASRRPFSTTSSSAIVRAFTERRYSRPKPPTRSRITTAEPVVARKSALSARCS